MGFFADDTERQAYRDRLCVECSHLDGCAVWALHEEWHSEKIADGYGEIWKQQALDWFIARVITSPASRPFGENMRCAMFNNVP